MKAIAKTTKPINLLDPQHRDLLEETPHVVIWSHFKEARTGAGQIKILAPNLPNEANDEDFQKFMAEAGDVDLAVAAYMSSFDSVDRETLEAEATELGVKFSAKLGDDKLAVRIAQAKTKAVGK
jgi:hypothetical protein